MDEKRLNILYVDDETDLLDIGKLFMERLGNLVVDTAISAEKALEKIAIASYDGIVSDYQMPGMDGIQLLQEVRKRFGDIPFILFTGRGREEVVIQAINNGADFYLQKGGEPKSQFAELVHQIHQAVRRKEAERAVKESEKRLILAQEIAMTGAWEYNPAERTIWGSAEGLSLFGYPPVAGYYTIEDIESCIPDRERVHQALVDLLEHDIPYDIEYAIFPADGSAEKYIHSRARCERDQDGNIVRVIGVIQDITQRKRAEDELQAAYEQIRASEETLQQNYQLLLSHEQALQESEERFRTLFDHAPYACMLFDKNGIYLLTNSYYEKITGYSADEVLGKKIGDLDIIPPEFRTVIDEKLHKHGYFDGYELTIRTKDGTLKTMLASAVYVEYRGEREILSTMIDVTERRRIEDSLRRSNEQIIGIANTIPGVVFQYYAKDTGESGLRYVSNRVYEILGVEGDLSNFLDLFISGIVDEDKERFLASIEKAVRNESKWVFDGRYRRPDGYIIYFRGMAEPVRASDELLFSGVILDVTAEKEADSRLQSERQFSRLLLDTSPAFIVAIGADGKTIMMNQLLLDTLEYTEEEVKGKDYLQTFVPPEDRDLVAEVFSRIVQDTSATLNENRIVSKSGKIFLVEWRGRPFFDSTGNLGFFVGVGIDITHQREEEKRLKRSEERYRSLIETTGTGYVVLDMQGKVLDANEEYIRLTGRDSLQKIMGRPVTEWTASYDVERNTEEVRKCIETGSVKGLRVDYIHPDGFIQPIELNASVFKSEGESVILTLCREIEKQG